MGSESENVRKWTGKQLALMYWLAQSKYDRLPTNEGELSKEIGVTTRTFRRWKKQPGFMDDVRAIAKEQLADGLPEVYASIYREAIKGSYQHARLALELVGDIGAEHDPSVNILINYVD